MSADHRKHSRVAMEVGVRFRTSSASIEDFVEKQATNVSRGGIFIRCISPKDAGTMVRFELVLQGGDTALKGLGRVAWSRRPGPYTTGEPGMGIEFVELEAESRDRLERALEAAGFGPNDVTGPGPEKPTLIGLAVP